MASHQEVPGLTSVIAFLASSSTTIVRSRLVSSADGEIAVPGQGRGQRSACLHAG